MGKFSGSVMAGNVTGLLLWGIMLAGVFANNVGRRPDTFLPAPSVLAIVTLLPVVVLLVSWHLRDSASFVRRYVWFLWNMAWILMTLFAALLLLEDRATEGEVPMWIADLAHSVVFLGIPMMLLNLLLLALLWRSGSRAPAHSQKGEEQ